MSSFPCHQPGGLWHSPPIKALSYSWARSDGFPGAMHNVAMAGSIRQHNLLHASPMVMACAKPQNAPYMSYNGGASWGQTFKNILANAMKVGQVAHETGVTKAVGNILHKISGVPSAPMPMERGEVAPGVRGPELGQPQAKRNRFGGAGGAFF